MIAQCQYTGVEFEATSKRQKNHPAVTALLTEAAKDKYNPGAYGVAKTALASARQAGMTDIDAILSFVRSKTNGASQSAYDKRNEDEQVKKAADQQRRLLKDHGYRWHKEDEESMDVFGATAFEAAYGPHASSVWTLNSPDGREVSITQALKEIEAK